jgi:hypothetical protein
MFARSDPGASVMQTASLRYFGLAVILAAGVAGATAPPWNATGATTSGPRPIYGVTSKPVKLDVKHLRKQQRGTHPDLSRPFLDRDPRASRTPRAPRRRGISVLSPSPMTSPAQAAPPFTGSGIPLMDVDRQETLYPTDQAMQPPDTQLAAGPAALVEADNSTLSVWSKTGALGTTADLNAFFSVPLGYTFSDPRIFYDAASSRWFLSGMSFNTVGAGETYLAVSATADPAAGWNKYVLESAQDLLLDQPMIGASADKLVISWNDFSGGLSANPTFVGEETWVLEKSDLLAGAAGAKAIFGPDATRFRIVPAVSSSTSTATEWLAYSEAACSHCSAGTGAIGVVAVTGSPAALNVAWTETDPHSPALSDPPPPRQPSGVAVTTEIGDHFTSVFWFQGLLWMAGNDGCVPANDQASRSCLRLIRVVTASATPIIDADFDVGVSGLDLYYPAVAMDASANLFVAFSESSSSMFPSAAELQTPAPNPSLIVTSTLIAGGQASYLRGTSNRWGDYSAAAADPSDPNVVWTTAEYQASTFDPGDWGTATLAARMQLRTSTFRASPAATPSRAPITQSSPAPSPSPR